MPSNFNFKTKSNVNLENIKLKDGFDVGKFIVESDVDYVYSLSEGVYRLLNLREFGLTDQSVVLDLISSGSTVCVIEGLNMEAYNFDEEKLKDALLKM